MRCPTLFTLIVAATATAASAEPKQEEISGRVSLNENDGTKSDEPRPPSDWVELATPTPAKHGTEFIVVGREAGTFSKLRVEATTGRTNLRKVKVFFDDGTTKTVLIDKALSAKRRKSALVELGNAKSIDRIVVTTETHTRGEYAVYGSGGIAPSGVVSSR